MDNPQHHVLHDPFLTIKRAAPTIALIITLASTIWMSTAFAVTGARPPFQSYSPDIDVFPQNFAIAEDQRGIVYVGSTDGLLTFDGERWLLTPLPNGGLVRSLTMAEDQRVYVGGYDEFGFAEPDTTGKLVYTSLAKLFRNALKDDLFADIWDISISPEGVFFKGLQHVFLWSPSTGETKFWFWQSRFGALRHHKGDTFLQFRGEGFRRYQDGTWQPLPATQSLTELIIQLVPLPDDGLLTISRNGDWKRFTSDAVTPYAMPSNMPRSSKLTDGVMLDENTMAFSGDLGMLYFYDLRNKKVEKINMGGGFLSDLARSQQGNLLTVDDAGIHHVPWPAKWTLLDKLNGLIGSVFSVRQFDDDIYALAGSGVYKKSSGADQFNRMDWSEHETWDLVALEDGSKILANSYVLRLITDQGAVDISDETIYPRILKRSRANPNLIYVGTEIGIGLLEKRRKGWELVYHKADMKNLRVTSIVETEENSVLIGSERDGLQQVDFILGEQWRAVATSIGPKDGILYGSAPKAHVSRDGDGSLLIATSGGFFSPQGDHYVSALSELEALRKPNEIISLQASPDGSLWGYTYKSLYRRTNDQRWIEENIGNVRQGSINAISFSNSGQVYVSANASIMVHDPHQKDPVVHPKSVSLRAVELRRKNEPSRLLSLHQAVSVEPEPTLSFRYALPDLANLDKVRYRARMLPIEPEFSSWADNAQFTYYGLSADDYTFEVEAQDDRGTTSAIAPYKLTILPYWHQEPSIRILGLVVTIIIIGLIILCSVRARSKILANENARLESMVSERTRELASANRQLESIAHLDGLTEIPNRRRLDTYLKEVWQQCIERDRALAVVMLDVDYFKAYNDELGHPAGDALLKQLAHLLSQSLRRGEDLVARYGGEEFLVVLPGADAEAALEVAESMRRKVEKSDLAITVSIGVAANQGAEFTDIEQLVNAADQALYKAKNDGRNLVRLTRS
ncbi:MAG: diguanylate cyclase (GGDEF)-like protein [Candidatus Azotimanducaceae bacterium]|jgi:diguanylate cyclase (GGDEF)-like protein